jgi:hypothetical protein
LKCSQEIYCGLNVDPVYPKKAAYAGEAFCSNPGKISRVKIFPMET